MADTAHTSTAQDSPASRQIRVFLSSTFRDFMEERDLLVKQVFPELRRKARERGVDVVDVDLRWGITEEESRQGKVIPICLGEIDRCRPYFVGMLGERYGWIPPADQYSPEVIERHPWLKEHLGGVSVTELEILHGVLNDPAMAGRAFFYSRDSSWSTSQSEPGFVCETAEEEAKLKNLKQRIRDSRFPVAENLADPKALADQIGRDLWDLIEEQYPDLDEADALEREERQHASYRRSRLGVYLGGNRSINQLERWIDAGQQKILIAGESGAGKSALIANWIEAHQQNHPEDVVLAHHLGCSNDASAIRPLLARLIDTAKQQLPEVYGYSLSVPQDWWELVAKAVEALQSLGRWAQQNNHRWIWVLDGLDRLDQDDQKALPWLPLTIPEGVVIMASALECPAREILLERKFKTRTIAPLKAKEQDALIQQYLGRYTKQLIAELRNTILSHPLAGSPLFLRVLLEELRQCGRYETLAEQLAGYLSAETIDDLYERVLERLEADGNGKNVRKVMTALWASRAGLSEEELLSITGLKPLEWAPIDLALEEALGRNGNQLVLDHDYLRKAISDRYLTLEKERREAHSLLADVFLTRQKWGHRRVEELPWQLQRSRRVHDLLDLVTDIASLQELLKIRGCQEIVQLWNYIKAHINKELDDAIADGAQRELERRRSRPAEMVSLLGLIGDLLKEAGLYRKTLIDIRRSAYELCIDADFSDMEKQMTCLSNLAETLQLSGHHQDAIELHSECLSLREKILGQEHPDTISSANNLGITHFTMGAYQEAEALFKQCLEKRIKSLGKHHPSTLASMNNLAAICHYTNKPEKAQSLYSECLAAKVRAIGQNHPSTLQTATNLANFYSSTGKEAQAERLYIMSLDGLRAIYGDGHPDAIKALYNLAILQSERSDFEKAEASLLEACKKYEEILGMEHPETARAFHNIGTLYKEMGRFDQAIIYLEKSIGIHTARDGERSPDAIRSLHCIGLTYSDIGDYEKAEEAIKQALLESHKLFGDNHPETSSLQETLAEIKKSRRGS